MGDIIKDIATWKLPEWLLAAGNLLWIAAYVASAWRSFRDRLPAIPIAAIVLNVAWEYIFLSCEPFKLTGIVSGASGNYCHAPSSAMFWLLAAWFGLDLLLLAQAAIWGSDLSARAPSEPSAPTLQWWTLLGAALIGAVTLEVMFIMNFDDENGILTAWVLNLIMSVLFIDLVRLRRRGAGLSYSAAWFKLLGSALNAVWAILMLKPLEPALLALFVFVILLDLVYIWMLGRARAAPVERPALATG
jgi:hypothetical protein